MARELLLDTGAFVALVSRSERRHGDCVAALDAWTGAIVTTEAVVTETLYLLGPRVAVDPVCIAIVLLGAENLGQRVPARPPFRSGLALAGDEAGIAFAQLKVEIEAIAAVKAG